MVVGHVDKMATIKCEVVLGIVVADVNVGATVAGMNALVVVVAGYFVRTYCSNLPLFALPCTLKTALCPIDDINTTTTTK